MAKIFGFHDNSACGYYRVTMPLDAVAHFGKHEIQTVVGWSEECRKFPVIIGQRIGRDGASAMWRRLRAGHRLIYETDDDVFSIDVMNIYAKMEYSEALRDEVTQAITVANAVTVSTVPLGEVLRPYNPDIHVVPNFIDGKLLSVQRPQRGRVVIGWSGGHSHYTDWQAAATPIRKFLQRNPDVELHVIGTNFAKVFKIPCRETAWFGQIWDYYCGIDFDIGVIPLAPITFNRSKSHIKALEYAALGIPVIASDMEPYRDFVVHGETGFLVKHDYEWGRYLQRLVKDGALRKKMGEAAKERAADFTVQKNWQLWERAWLGE